MYKLKINDIVVIRKNLVMSISIIKNGFDDNIKRTVFMLNDLEETNYGRVLYKNTSLRKFNYVVSFLLTDDFLEFDNGELTVDIETQSDDDCVEISATIFSLDSWETYEAENSYFDFDEYENNISKINSNIPTINIKEIK